MKYLKLFEDLNSDGYERISAPKLYNWLEQGSLDSLNDGDLKIVSKGLLAYSSNLTVYVDKLYDMDMDIVNINVIRASNNDCQMCVYKLHDEWYSLKFKLYGRSEVYFRCDQLDGLLNCIKNLPKS